MEKPKMETKLSGKDLANFNEYVSILSILKEAIPSRKKKMDRNQLYDILYCSKRLEELQSNEQLRDYVKSTSNTIDSLLSNYTREELDHIANNHSRRHSRLDRIRDIKTYANIDPYRLGVSEVILSIIQTLTGSLIIVLAALIVLAATKDIATLFTNELYICMFSIICMIIEPLAIIGCALVALAGLLQIADLLMYLYSEVIFNSNDRIEIVNDIIYLIEKKSEEKENKENGLKIMLTLRKQFKKSKGIEKLRTGVDIEVEYGKQFARVR